MASRSSTSRDSGSRSAGYGAITIDSDALAYYSHAWATPDIALYAARLVLRRPFHDHASADADRRAESASIFLSLFAPGEIVDLTLSR